MPPNAGDSIQPTFATTNDNSKHLILTRKKKPLPILEGVRVTDVAAEGKAVARVDDRVIFIPWATPGDVVDVRLTRKRSHYAEGTITAFHERSPLRVEPFCEHFGVCGGCKWQHLPYDEQLRFKQQQVVDALRRIGHVTPGEVLPILGSERTTHYRNKLEFTFSNRRWLTTEEVESEVDYADMNALGFHIPGMFDKVLDIHRCWLQDEVSNRIRLSIKQYCLTHEGYPFFDLKRNEGFVRTLMIRTSSAGGVMVVMAFYYEDRARREALLDHVAQEVPEITSLMYVINEKCNDTLTDQDILLYRGADHLIERMEDLQFKVGPKSFYQTNSEQAYRLYSVVREFADLSGGETVYDLYTGTGTIANFVARRARRVVGIEYVPEAIDDARVNARLNAIDNADFYAGDMKDLLTEDFIAAHGRPDVVITDPPRTGMHNDVIDTILRATPARIVYVSCNPATQARDIARMADRYEVVRIRPVDMFPHTHHVENVALLRRKEGGERLN